MPIHVIFFEYKQTAHRQHSAKTVITYVKCVCNREKDMNLDLFDYRFCCTLNIWHEIQLKSLCRIWNKLSCGYVQFYI